MRSVLTMAYGRIRLAPTKFESTSYTRYSDYEKCPFMAYLKHIKKVPTPANSAMQRGSDIHTLCEQYIKGNISRRPKELASFDKLFRDLRAKYRKTPELMTVENTWAFTKTWARTTYDDWNNCSLRIKVDCAHVVQKGERKTLDIIDFKTGRNRPEMAAIYEQQLDLFATGGLIIHDDVIEVTPRLVYLDEGTEVFGTTYTRKDVDGLVRKWDKAFTPMFKDKKFAPRPGNACRWCPFRAEAAATGGGQCKF